MSSSDFDSLPVAEIMRRWPATVRIFMQYRLLCIGCPIGRFHTIADAAREHDMEAAALRGAIVRFTDPPGVADPPPPLQ